MGSERAVKGTREVIDVGCIEKPSDVPYRYLGVLKTLLDQHWPAIAGRLGNEEATVGLVEGGGDRKTARWGLAVSIGSEPENAFVNVRWTPGMGPSELFGLLVFAMADELMRLVRVSSLAGPEGNGNG